ncbi:MAG: type II toxin-antitoxin system HipA family toxin [Oscillospiraceae bacterium]|nr:type II toxin-antitoxin system HipA family toxin [Oscillospiraceae bacterium]
MNEKIIYVYADWIKPFPLMIGKLFVSDNRRKELFSFEYSKDWLRSAYGGFIFDPDLHSYEGRQYAPDKPLFGVFSDSCPDRWGRLLMECWEAILAREENRKPRALKESDYLLGVYDETRIGALRFSIEENGSFLSADKGLCSPPWTTLRTLESASISMALLGKTDGEGADGTSYLDIASFIRANGASPKQDLKELWKRVVFNMAVSNTDDHLRNHGFLLTEYGWILSPLYDVNPNIYGDTLSLNVSMNDNTISFDLAIETAEYYNIKTDEAKNIVADIQKIVDMNWRAIASSYGSSRDAVSRMEPAFAMEYK